MIKQEISPKKIAANRKNALKSTGPKTRAGKQVVKWNALKHGLLAKEIVIDDGDGRENKTQFNTILRTLREEYDPVGIVEEMLVERIAVCYWRLRRVIRCEIGEIRKQLDNVISNEYIAIAENINLEKDYSILQGSQANMLKTTFGINYLIHVLDIVKQDFNEEGKLSEYAKKKLIKYFGVDDEGLAVECMAIDNMANEQQTNSTPKAEEPLPPPEKCNKMIHKLLENEKERLEGIKEIIIDIEHMAIEAKLSSYYLPSKEAVDKILRYETTIERQLYRAINQLERIQRSRQGEAISPPINLQISTEN